MSTHELDPRFAKTFPTSPTKGDLKRFEIISVTMKLVASKGINSFSFDQIAKQLGTRRSHITYYFSSREDLLNDIFKFITMTAQDITIEQVRMVESPKDQLIAVARGAFLWSERFPEQYKMMLLFYFICSHNEKFRRFHSDVRQIGLSRIEALLRSILEVRPERVILIPSLARQFQAVITGLLVERFSCNSTQEVHYQQTVSDFYDLIIGE